MYRLITSVISGLLVWCGVNALQAQAGEAGILFGFAVMVGLLGLNSDQ